jgi:peptidyl-prolyl cis-trans isomerase D
MLQALRSTVGSWVVKILFVLLIASFGIWGIGDIFRNSTSNTVAEVGDVKITTVELDQAFQQEMNRLRQMMGGQQIDADQARAMGLLDQALQQLIQRHLFTLAANDAGLRIGEQSVLRQIHEEPAFRNQLGQFDPDLFRRILATNQLSEQAYVDLLRGDIARSDLIGAVATGAAAPAPLVDALYRRQNERRVAETVFLPNSAVTDVGVPDDATLAAFHQDKAVRFTAPEYRMLTIGKLAIEDIAGEIAVSDDDLRAAYEARSGEFRTPEQRTIEQVLVGDEVIARQIESAMKGGQTLASAAAAAGTEAMTVPGIVRDDLVSDLADPVFSLPVGGVTAPIQTPLGWHIVSVTAIEPAAEQSFEQVRDQLLADERRDRAANQVYDTANKVEDMLAGGATLEEASEQLGLRLIKLDAVDATGKKPDGTTIDDLSALQPMLQSAFSLGKGDVSRLTETPNGAYFAVRVDDVVPAALRPLDTIRDEVIAAWQADQRAIQTAERARQAADRLRADAAPAAVAAEFPGAEAGTTPALSRDGRNSGKLPPGLVQQVFEMKPGDVAASATPDGQIVVRMKEIQAADPAAAAPQVSQLRDRVTQSLSTDLVAQFAEALRGQYPVRIHQQTIDTMYR